MNHHNQPDHIRFTIGCICFLCAICAVGSVFLILKGYDAGGGQLTMAVNSGISGLVGFLGRGVLQAAASKAEVNTQGGTANITQPEAPAQQQTTP